MNRYHPMTIRRLDCIRGLGLAVALILMQWGGQI